MMDKDQNNNSHFLTSAVEVCHHQRFMSHYVIRVAIQPQGFQFLSPPFDAFASHPKGGNTPRKMGTLQQVWPIQQLPWIRQTRKIPINAAVRRHRQASAEISPSVTPLQRTDWDPQHVEQKESGRIVQSFNFISDMFSAVFALCLRVRIYME